MTIRSVCVRSRRWQSVASTGRDSRSGVPETRRWTWEEDSVMPHSVRYGMNSATENMPQAAIRSRRRHPVADLAWHQECLPGRREASTVASRTSRRERARKSEERQVWIAVVGA